MDNESLKPRPACGPALPIPRACPRLRLVNDAVKLEAVAVKLWNEAKREKAKSAPK